MELNRPNFQVQETKSLYHTPNAGIYKNFKSIVLPILSSLAALAATTLIPLVATGIIAIANPYVLVGALAGALVIALVAAIFFGVKYRQGQGVRQAEQDINTGLFAGCKDLKQEGDHWYNLMVLWIDHTTKVFVDSKGKVLDKDALIKHFNEIFPVNHWMRQRVMNILKDSNSNLYKTLAREEFRRHADTAHFSSSSFYLGPDSRYTVSQVVEYWISLAIAAFTDCDGQIIDEKEFIESFKQCFPYGTYQRDELLRRFEEKYPDHSLFRVIRQTHVEQSKADKRDLTERSYIVARESYSSVEGELGQELRGLFYKFRLTRKKNPRVTELVDQWVDMVMNLYVKDGIVNHEARAVFREHVKKMFPTADLFAFVQKRVYAKHQDHDLYQEMQVIRQYHLRSWYDAHPCSERQSLAKQMVAESSSTIGLEALLEAKELSDLETIPLD